MRSRSLLPDRKQTSVSLKTQVSKDKGCDIEVWSMASGAKETLVQFLPRPLSVTVLDEQLNISVHRGQHQY